ncbi:hypothetical protein MVES_003694 [Malassezia vespertilionis]|uniref:Arrestin-like N-terminal domain-containing protein n=2 Tax=Malassezia vespertilionis TaxID=2020962 RepID=A0A2N1J7F6_9BASI|nr:hypothetical protein MVES_003694 [Malassezia vespertilionis]
MSIQDRKSSDAASIRAASIYSATSADTSRGYQASAAAPSVHTLTALPVRHNTNANAKTVHAYSGANGRLIVQYVHTAAYQRLNTPPQASPTYMGGSQLRGRGALVGRLILRCTDKERASEIRLKLKAVVTIQAPKASQATEGDMPNFSGLSPSTASTSSREQVLLQMEHRLRASDAKFRVAEKGPSQANAGGKLNKNGYYEWEFAFDIPEKGPGKGTCNSGFPSVGTNYPSSYVLESDVRKGTHKEEWASVKWYIKVTVERPGLFRSNNRLLVPFIYLPPPPESIAPTLLRRQALSLQIRSVIQRVQGPVVLPNDLVEPANKWTTETFMLTQAALGKPIKRSFFDKMLGNNKPKEERWAISYPGKPMAVFPLRAVIPFVLSLMHSGGMPLVVHPHVYLVQKVHLRARSTSAHTHYISHAKVLASPVGKSGMQKWFGWVQFPSWCSPTFDTQALGLEYFLQIKPLHEPAARPLLAIPVGLYCAPPRLTPAVPSVKRQQATNGSRTLLSDTASTASADAGIPSSPTQAMRSISLHGSPSASRRTSLGSAMRVPSTSTLSLRQTAAALDEPYGAGVAGIGRAHLLATEAMPDPCLRHASSSQALGAQVASAASLDAWPGRAADASSQSDATSMLRVAPPTLPTIPDNAALPTLPTIPDNTLPPVPPRSPRNSRPASLLSAGAATPSAPNTARADAESASLRDAGPMSQEEEQAWTMDILSNALNDDDGADFELPPSYFEATGIEDHEE